MSARLPLSAFIICQNEEAVLENCLLSLDQCAEIVIVDSGSTDGTFALIDRYIAAGWPIRFIRQAWLGFAGQKQFALEQCRQPWAINLDADERLDAALRAELPKLLEAPDSVAGWRFGRRPYLIGYGYTPPRVFEGMVFRLVRTGRGAYDLKQKVHEGIIAQGEVRDAPRSCSFLHYRALPLDAQIPKENKYSSLKADQMVEAGRAPRLLKMLFNPPVYFLQMYVRRGFWRCGWPGFIHAMTAFVYAFLTEAKLWQRAATARQAPRDERDGETR